MSKFEKTQISPVNPTERCNALGIISDISGRVVLDQELPMFCKIIHVSSGGDILWVGKDDRVNLITGAKDGSYHAIRAKKFMSTGTTWDGVSSGTTASLITWFGGV